MKIDINRSADKLVVHLNIDVHLLMAYHKFTCIKLNDNTYRMIVPFGLKDECNIGLEFYKNTFKLLIGEHYTQSNILSNKFTIPFSFRDYKASSIYSGYIDIPIYGYEHLVDDYIDNIHISLKLMSDNLTKFKNKYFPSQTV